MSTEINTLLLQRAADCIDYFEGKQPALRIENALERNDLEEVRKLVLICEATMSIEEFAPEPQGATDAY